METFLIYLAKSSGLILLFLCCYWLFLSRETFYSGNRYFLLAGLAASLIFPVITYSKTIWIDAPLMGNPIIVSTGQANLAEIAEIDWVSIFFFVYTFGVLFGLGRLGMQFLSLGRILRNGREIRDGKFKLFETGDPTQPFSFLNCVVYHPDNHSKDELEAILAHEKMHAAQFHSVDILLVHLFTIFQWCNPFIYLYKFHLKQNLEFLADAKTISLKIQKEKYQLLLLKNTLGDKHLSFVNPFFNSSVKKRIVMLNKEKSKKRNSIKYGLVFPLLVAFVFLFNVDTIAKIRPIDPSAVITDQEPLIDPKVYSIPKEASDDELEVLKKEIEKEGGELSLEGLKRNSKGQIIAVTISLKVSEFGRVAREFNNENGIEPILFGQNDKGGHSFLRNGENRTKSKKIETPHEKVQETKNATVYSISKNTSDSDLKKLKSTIENKGGTFSYSHKRNAVGEIIDLEFEIKYNGTGQFRSEPPFEKCYFGTFEGGGIFLADDEEAFRKLGPMMRKHLENPKPRKARSVNGKEKTRKTGENDKVYKAATGKNQSDEDMALLKNPKRSTGMLWSANSAGESMKSNITLSMENIVGENIYKHQSAIWGNGDKNAKGVLDIEADLTTKSYVAVKRTINNPTDNPKKSQWAAVYGTKADIREEDRGEGQDPWRVSAGVAPKNQDKMSATDLFEHSKKENPGLFQQDLKEALIIVEGQEMSKKEFDKIPVDEIESMSVLKGEMAQKKYGKKAKNGVLEIKLKKRGIMVDGPNQSPLIIIDGKESTQEAVKNIEKDNIESINILKVEQAIQEYGKKARDGAIEIVTKKN